MVVFLNLDQDPLHPLDPGGVLTSSLRYDPDSRAVRNIHGDNGQDQLPDVTENACVDADANASGFSAALACYPVATKLASFLDLNTLHALARTCRRFRTNLLQFRGQLMARTLRCSNDRPFPLPCSSNDGAESAAQPAYRLQRWDVAPSYGIASDYVVTGKLGPCARDMVGACRRCGRVVCRNCIMKPPMPARLSGRHRRLCSACAKAPFSTVMNSDVFHDSYHGGQAQQSQQPSSPCHGPTSWRRYSMNADGESSDSEKSLFTSGAFAREPCSCDEAVFICQPCGHAVASADTTYKRIWTWRTRYSMGGLGTGIGEGNEGVKCGRGASCLAAEDIEVELDYATGPEDGAGAAVSGATSPAPESTSMAPFFHGSDDALAGGDSRSNTPGSLHEGNYFSTGGGSFEEKAGYMRQEIEGIGGVVRSKVKKRVRVGRTVKEYEDEREHASYLGREVRMERRSWCGWCDRVIPSREDRSLF